MTEGVLYHHSATLLDDGRVLVAGGQSVISGRDSPPGIPLAEVYDPSTGLWSPTGSMADPRRRHAAVLLQDGTVMVSGGLTERDKRDVCCADIEYVFPVASAEVYDPDTGTWSRAGDMPSSKGRHSLMQLENGIVLAIGGSGTSTALYDPTAGTWASGRESATETEFRSAALLGNGNVLVIGGGDFVQGGAPHEALDLAEVYDPLLGSWAVAESLLEVRRQPRATVLTDGRVLVTGGSGGGDGRPLKTAEIYDPSTGTWSSAGEMGFSRELHTATLLMDGRVLVTGGPGNEAEIFDPSSGSWSRVGNMLTRRQAHTATLLSDGRVLIAGGARGSGRDPFPDDSAEVYDPSTDTWTGSTEAAP